ncbi:MAG: glycosyltransferase family 4 protein [bacterium]|nr:glycosyltransferase family 4 protein [bacterium]
MKVLIIHYRVGRTDGVSIEISAWKEILSKQKHEVVLASGPVNVGADYVVDGLEAQLNPPVFELDNEAFGGFKNMTSESWAVTFLANQQKLNNQFTQLINKVLPDRIIVSNIFSVGENLAAAGALFQTLAISGISTVAIHHDFYWENPRYRRPSSPLVEEQLEKYFPPTGPWLKHACINTLAQKELITRKGIKATLLYDTMDFSQPAVDSNGDCRALLARSGLAPDDLIVLQATRIVRRKNIELAIDLVSQLKEKATQLGKQRVVLVMAGYAEKRDEGYLKLLQDYARALDITVVHLNEVSSHPVSDMPACTLMGIYPYADIISYPSQAEGFGNQFLEAIHAKKPIVVFEYPVFKTDIKPLGFEVVSLGDELSFDSQTGLAKVKPEVIARAAEEVVAILANSQKRQQMVEHNFNIGADNFSYQQTGKILTKLLA